MHSTQPVNAVIQALTSYRSLAWMAALTAALHTATSKADDKPTATDKPQLRIVLVGDSTVTDQSGWGAGFAKRIAPDAECINMARSGRSSKSYRDEGHWAKALALKPDYLLIQFGHNDQSGKGPARETAPETTFREN